MKNIHLLPTDKPSKISYDKDGNLLFAPYTGFVESDGKQHIYITDDSEIKEGDYYITNLDCKVLKCESVFRTLVYSDADYGRSLSRCKKIILTTDQELIADGVQFIDDEFLEWFVRNPSCEFVKTTKDKIRQDKEFNNVSHWNISEYKIIIPQEETKQETLEEAAKNYAEENDDCYTNDYYGFVKGAKWKEEQMHSDKIINILDDITYWDNCPEEYKETISLFTKQFKKK